MPDQIPGSRDIRIGTNDSLSVAGASTLRIGRNSSRVQDNQRLSAGKHRVLQAGDQLQPVCGDVVMQGSKILQN